MTGKFVFVSAVCPYPADSGKKVFIDGLLRYMIEKIGAQNVHYLIIGSVDPGKISLFKEKFGINVVHVGSVRTGEILGNALMSFLERLPKSFQECVLFSRKIQSNLFRIIRGIDPSVVVSDTLRIGQYFERERPSGAKYILYMEDLFAIRYERMLESSNNQASLNAAGNFISNIPSVFRGLLNSPFVERFLLSIEFARVSRRENQLPNEFDLNLLLNEDDVAKLMRVAPAAKVNQIPPLLKISSKGQRDWIGEPSFVFVGDLKVSENSVSLEIFIRKCMEKIIAKLPAFKLIVIGKGIPLSLKEMIDKYPKNIEYLGFVENIDTILSKCAAMLIPMLYGSGIRFKALDAFVRGVPVISTPLGVEGLGLEGLDVCMISEQIEQMPDLIVSVLDKRTNQTLSDNGKMFFSERFAYDRVCRFYDSIFESR